MGALTNWDILSSFTLLYLCSPFCTVVEACMHNHTISLGTSHTTPETFTQTKDKDHSLTDNFGVNEGVGPSFRVDVWWSIWKQLKDVSLCLRCWRMQREPGPLLQSSPSQQKGNVLWACLLNASPLPTLRIHCTPPRGWLDGALMTLRSRKTCECIFDLVIEKHFALLHLLSSKVVYATYLLEI